MSEVIVITSGKGGVGKTTTTANIGTGLAQLNKKVVMIDTDIGLRNLDVVMGLENRIVYNLVDVIEGKCRIRQALIKDKRYPELCLLPSAQTRDKDAVTPEQMVALINELREEFDYILLDCPAGIEQGFKNAVAGADRALVVTTPEVSAIRDADRIVKSSCCHRQRNLNEFRIFGAQILRGNAAPAGVVYVSRGTKDRQVVDGTRPCPACRQRRGAVGAESPSGHSSLSLSGRRQRTHPRPPECHHRRGRGKSFSVL